MSKTRTINAVDHTMHYRWTIIVKVSLDYSSLLFSNCFKQNTRMQRLQMIKSTRIIDYIQFQRAWAHWHGKLVHKSHSACNCKYVSSKGKNKYCTVIYLWCHSACLISWCRGKLREWRSVTVCFHRPVCGESPYLPPFPRQSFEL